MYKRHILSYDWLKKDHVENAPDWCSVDLRDGNQALIVPMELKEKLEFFSYLISLGFKEIEIGFPAASETEFEFCRKLIEDGLIPDDVTIQVLTQSRENIIKRTFEALDGCKNAIIHLYNSTSVAQRNQVFKKSEEQIIDIAKFGANLLLEYSNKYKGNYNFEYSPESFTGTEMEFALKICNEVLDIWKPTPNKKAIINLPVTVQLSSPHVYACQVEYISKNIKYKDCVKISLHPHNDRGCAVADAELGLLAGADRVEGTLFGNGERTGNVDIITLALNMYSQGIDPKLNLDDMPTVVKKYEKFTNMSVYERQPYAGKLVFAAFSGSHQDAIAKGISYRKENNLTIWNVPYLPIDPSDVGREYESDVIRINSQSGKGGIGYILKTRFGLDMPKNMREDFGYAVKSISDKGHKEMQPEELLEIFNRRYVNLNRPVSIEKVQYEQNGGISSHVCINISGNVYNCKGHGNGRLDSVVEAINPVLDFAININDYSEHALGFGSNSKACCYVCIMVEEELFWGVGIHNDIITASVNALISAINRYK
ncbi:MAG: 2-isopropylmalate synthase, partial [Oscillospiraceae bacterium]|nr:2-isopropylmalate synthase [Oscillospiraceae bacterium]